MGEVLLGNLANFIFWENLTVVLVWKCSINYASRNRVKTLTLNTDLTTFCKLTAFFFMVPLLLLSLVQMSLKQWGSFWELGHRSGQGGWVLPHLFPPQLSLIPEFVQGKEQKIHFCPSKTLQQIRTGWDQVAEENGMRWNCAQMLCSAGKNWLLPCSVWSEPCSEGMMCWFFMKQSPFRIYRMPLSLVSVDFAWWENQNISVIVGVPQLCSGTGAAPAPQELGTALKLCEL